jgi:hypothetical protein
MQLIHHLVNRIQTLTDGCGYESNKVTLSTNADQNDQCPYETGTIITVAFGGKNTYFSSVYPMDVITKPEYMYSASLTKPTHRASAAAIISGVTGFLCFSRICGSCEVNCHQQCIEQIKTQIGTKKVHCIGEMKTIRDQISNQIVSDPQEAELILLTVDGLNEDTSYDPESGASMICIGPSAGGIASLLGREHFCPYGHTKPTEQIVTQS